MVASEDGEHAGLPGEGCLACRVGEHAFCSGSRCRCGHSKISLQKKAQWPAVRPVVPYYRERVFPSNDEVR